MSDTPTPHVPRSQPHRKILPHTPPPWVSSGAPFFITICGTPRNTNQFCHDKIARDIFSAAGFYNANGTWYSSLLLLMPDHIHALISFPRESAIKKTISAWKGYIAKQCGITWQRDFFDHRLRHDESQQLKASYIRNNPVRAGLVQSPEAWPYVWMPEG